MPKYCEHWTGLLLPVEHMNSWATSSKDHYFYSKPALDAFSRDVAQYRIDSFRSLLTTTVQDGGKINDC